MGSTNPHSKYIKVPSRKNRDLSYLLREVSCSKLDTAQKCMRKFFWRYVAKVGDHRTWKMHVGSSVDTGLNYGYSEKAKSGKDEPLDAITDATMDDFKDTMELVDWKSGGSPSESEDHVRKIIKTFRYEVMPEVNPAKDKDNKPLVQARIERDIPAINTRLIGYVDLIEEDETIVDNKTSCGSRWTVGRALQSKQLPAYAIIRNPHSPPSFRFDVVSSLKTKCTKDIFSMYPSREIIESFLSETNFILALIHEACRRYEELGDDSLFTPNTSGWWCSHSQCSYAYLCENKLSLKIKP